MDTTRENIRKLIENIYMGSISNYKDEVLNCLWALYEIGNIQWYQDYERLCERRREGIL